MIGAETSGEWLADPLVWAAGVPHERLRALRDSEPVSWHEHPEGLRGFWSVNRWADAYQVLHDPETFSSRYGVVNLDDLSANLLDVRRTFLEEDPPRHDEIRNPLEARFMPRAVRAMEAYLVSVVDRVQEAALAATGPVEAVAALAEPVPIRVLGTMLGVSEDRLDDLVRWGSELLAAPPTDVDDDELARLPFGHPTALEVFELADEMMALRRDGSRVAEYNDVAADLLGVRVDGEPLSDDEFRATFVMLVLAGNETTRHSITTGLLAFAEYPDQWLKLAADPTLEASAAEEIIRWATPINWHRRQVMSDVSLGGADLKAGDKLIVNFASANRDERRIDRPDEFDITRRPNFNIAFGRGGPHHCLGAHLARLEIRVFFRQLMTRVESVEAAGEATRLVSNHISGYTSAPIRLIASDQTRLESDW